MSKHRSTLSKLHSTLLPKNGNNVERVYRKISSFRQSRMLLRQCCRFWQQCRTKFRPFDQVETNWTCSICFDLRKDEISFDIVEKIVRIVALDNVASTLLLVWTGLYTWTIDCLIIYRNVISRNLCPLNSTILLRRVVFHTRKIVK